RPLVAAFLRLQTAEVEAAGGGVPVAGDRVEEEAAQGGAGVGVLVLEAGPLGLGAAEAGQGQAVHDRDAVRGVAVEAPQAVGAAGQDDLEAVSVADGDAVELQVADGPE